MTDNQTILKRMADIETMAYALIHECQQTRMLLEKEGVSTSSTTTSSAIAEEARRNLRARLLTSKK